MCVGFLSEAAELCLLSPPARCGVGSCWPLLVWLLCLFLEHLRFSASYLAPVSGPTPAVDVCC